MTGVLLINLGTPEATDYWSMRRYLKEFLSDRRVIEINRLLWWPLLNGIILTTRPGRSGRNYKAIWNEERNESPLKTVTRSQAEALGARLSGDHPRIVVDWAMRYGKPSIVDGVKALTERGCERILVVPLYPQYSASTTATVCDKVFDALKTLRHQPSIRIAPPYFADPAYIGALKASLIEGIEALSFEPEAVLASFHGLPQDYAHKGDPYPEHCDETVRLLREALGWDEEKLRLTYQSRVGPAEWLKPYTDETIQELAKSGVRNLAVIMPGFAADCLETLEEIAIAAAKTFRAAGGENFAAIPCLNDGEPGMAMIEALVLQELKGWLDS